MNMLGLCLDYTILLKVLDEFVLGRFGHLDYEFVFGLGTRIMRQDDVILNAWNDLMTHETGRRDP